jgi:hypothetical protein
VQGYGVGYSVLQVTRSANSSGQAEPSITVIGCVIITGNSPGGITYKFADQISGSELSEDPFQSKGDENPPQNDMSRLITVLSDDTPPATRLRITIHAFFWPSGENLVLTDIPVPSGT